jgi:hypothetical protein
LRFLADENFPRAAVTALEAAGHDIAWVRLAAPGAADAECPGGGCVRKPDPSDIRQGFWRVGRPIGVAARLRDRALSCSCAKFRSGGTTSCCSDRGARRLERSFLGRRAKSREDAPASVSPWGPIGDIELAVRVDRDAARQVELALGLARLAPRFDDKAPTVRTVMRREPLGCSSRPRQVAWPSSGGLLSCSSVEFPDLPGGTGQVGVIHQRRRLPLFGL